MTNQSEHDRDEQREQDVATDDGVADSRATGGDPDSDDSAPDAESTTGTGESGDFVGRIAGQDDGFAGETGAEARSIRR